MIFRSALRTLLKTPFVTLVAVASLALGIGANTAIYSIFEQVLRRPLPVSEPGRLVNFGAPAPKPGSTSCNQAGDCDAVFSYPMFRDLEREQSSFAGIAAHCLFGVNITIGGVTESADSVLVSGGYFSTLSLTPALGRLLGPDDDRVPGEGSVVVLSHAFWTERLGANPDVLTRPITVSGRPMTVVGVAPRGFDGTTFGTRPSIFLPITLRDIIAPVVAPAPNTFDNRRNYWMYVFGRLKPGISLEQARAAINVPYHAILNDIEAPLQIGMSEQTLDRFRQRQITLENGAHGQTNAVTAARGSLTLLLGVTVFVLLIACANIANLLLARSASRAGEMAVRLSIGASRRHLIVQLLTESCLLAAAGGLAGVLVAHWTLGVLTQMLPPSADVVFELNWSILPVAASVTLATGFLFGLFPALHSTRPDLVTSLKGLAGQASSGRAASRFRTTLATAQIALSMTLLVVAGLFTRSLFNISRADLGLNPDHVVSFRVSPVLSGYDPRRSRQLFERIEDELTGIAGVISVSSSTVGVITGSNNNNNVLVEGFEAGPDTDVTSRFNRIGPGFFRTLGIPVISGREFTRADAFGGAKVAMVNEAFLKKFNLDGDAVGRHMGLRVDNKTDMTIVGIVRNAKYSEVKQAMLPTFYVPYRQTNVGSLSFYVRTSGDPEAFMASVRTAVSRIDATLPVDNLYALTEQIRQNVFLDRFISALATAFAVLATLLAAIGLYGVLAYTVSLRTKEIGLRMALGATSAGVQGLVLRQVAAMVLTGVTIGVVAALGLGRLAESLLFEMKGWDPVVLVSAAIGLAFAALTAGLLPARRAARVDPMRALRYE
jgi:putative ABC transport system permease protein